MKILRVNFRDGVYLNGQVAQAIGIVEEGEGEAPAMTLMGLKRVSSITPTAAGLTITQGPRTFFVPWTSISSCEVMPETIEKAPPAMVETRGAKGKVVAGDLL